MWEPENISECISHKNEIKNIINWLESFFKSKKKKKKDIKPNLLIWGKSGIGKSVSTKIAISEKGYEIIYINSNEINCKAKDMDKFIENKLKNPNCFLKNMGNKKVFIIDNLEKVISCNEKTYCEKIAKINSNKKIAPVIFITGKNHNKLSDTIKKKFETKILPFKKPSQNEMIEIAAYVIKQKDAKIDEEVFYKLINRANTDFRKLLDSIEDLVELFGSPIDENKYNRYLETSQNKDLDYDIYESTKNIYSDNNSIEKSLEYYNTEKVLVPLMIHQNFSEYLSNCNISSEKKIEVAKDILDNLRKGDLIENHIYSEQQWDLQEIHGFYSCYKPSQILSNYKPTKIDRFKFPLDLNRTSIKFINRKNITNFNKGNTSDLEKKDVMEYIYLGKIIKPYLDFKDFGMFTGKNYSDLAPIAKIDKINNKE